MRVLIDSNILIYMEDNHIIKDSIQTLQKILNLIREIEVVVHPLSLEDIKNDKNTARKNIISSKILTYPFLESYPSPDADQEFLNNFKNIYKINDKIDIAILYALYKDAVDLLITEDRGLHRRAEKLGLGERVLLIDDAINFFNKFIPKNEQISSPALKEDSVYNLRLEDSIFDELKKEYPEFPEWFKKIKREGRKCWVHYNDTDKIGALLIYKTEEDPIPSIPPLPINRRFKICTLIVSSKGNKIGELFIKISINYSIKNNISEIYLTHYTKENDQLVELITEYGFVKKATMPNGEDVFIKVLFPNKKELDRLQYEQIDERYYPIFYDGSKVEKYVLPIYLNFHNRLFTDFLPRQLTLDESCGRFIVEGNAIKKAYISQRRIKKVKKGDIILFYCVHPIKKITSIGVIEAAYPGVNESDEIMKLVAKRTVYSPGEIDRMKKPVMVILFRHHFHLENPLSLKILKEKNILSYAPRSISKIKHENYIRIKEYGKIDGRFTIN